MSTKNEKYSLKLQRSSDDKKQTIGTLFVLDGRRCKIYNCFTMELPWKHNQKRISRIPCGTYNVIKHRSRRFGSCFWVLQVPHRSEILIHAGNYNKDTLGCILPGKALKDINNDGIIDVSSSRSALNELLEIMPPKFTLTVIDEK